jgi:hypothetical protein
MCLVCDTGSVHSDGTVCCTVGGTVNIVGHTLISAMCAGVASMVTNQP